MERGSVKVDPNINYCKFCNIMKSQRYSVKAVGTRAFFRFTDIIDQACTFVLNMVSRKNIPFKMPGPFKLVVYNELI